ncbi:MAG: alpha/beta hydrolase [Candidatus Spechtbacterales bacterium]
MKKQVVVIHGGDLFETYEEYLEYLRAYELTLEKLNQKRWGENLADALGSEFQVIRPTMPNKRNARYVEWKIWFEKLLPYVEDGISIVGGSLGGTFVAKYLAENTFPKNIAATFLVAAPYDMEGAGQTLMDFVLPDDLDGLAKQGGKIFLYHSEDDPVVPFADAKKYQKDLPNATPRVFQDRGHFNQEEFPELVEDIQNL